VTALLRYQAAILLRSHRWVFPVILYAVLISVGGIGQKQALGQGLDWSAAMLLPVGALLNRSMLTAEPPASRACVAAAAGAARAQLATLLTALAGGAVLGLAGAGYELATSGGLAKMAAKGTLLPALGSGLAVAFVCLLVGSAVGALFNAPVIRHPTVALLSTVAAVVVGLVSSVSPASAALSGNGATVQSAPWPTGVPVLAAVGLVVICWTLSCVLAAVRGE
jgi:hypothetical protein